MQRIQLSFALLVTPKMAQADLSIRIAKCLSSVRQCGQICSLIFFRNVKKKKSMNPPGIERTH